MDGLRLGLRVQPSAASLASGCDRIRAEAGLPERFPAAALEEAAAARERGVTVYLPDRRTPLHPDGLGEGAASLWPGEDRPALLRTVDLDAAGEPVCAAVERATVRSRRALAYEEAQAEIEAGDGPPVLLREVGLRRLSREAEHGGVSLRSRRKRWRARATPTPSATRPRCRCRTGTPRSRCWRGSAPQRSWRGAGSACSAPWPPSSRAPSPRFAAAPGRSGWPGRKGAPTRRSCAASTRAIPVTRPSPCARRARWAMPATPPGPRGPARTRRPTPPSQPATPHVTAPIRRLADRVADEVVLALCARQDPPPWALQALDDMPAIMRETGSRARAAERAAVDYVEAVVLAPAP